MTYYDSACGRLALACRANKLVLCDWVVSPRHDRHLLRIFGTGCEKDGYVLPKVAGRSEDCPRVLRDAVSQLDEYFHGRRRWFSLAMHAAGSEFRRKVYSTLLSIPYGETVTYGEVAQLAGHPSAVRSVAGAIADNPLSIIIPCHRVVGAQPSSRLKYAGGADAKRILLDLESALERTIKPPFHEA